MAELYAQNRREGVPSYITEDYLLLGYSMVMADAVSDAEQKHALPELRALVHGLRDAVKAAKDADAAVRDGASSFLAVVADLVDEDEAARKDHTPAITEELRLVRAADGMAESAIAKQRLDYTQFAVRGHYTRSEDLGRYFRAVRYASAVLHPLKESEASAIDAAEADHLTARALLMSRLIAANPELQKAQAAFEARFAWLFGPPDDMGPADYAGAKAGSSLASWRAERFTAATKDGRQPTVFSGIVEADKLEKGVSIADVLTGWRLLPQRRSPDAIAQQGLVLPAVGVYAGSGKPESLVMIGGKPSKGFPLALELMSLLGSPTAGAKLDARDERNYEGYAKAAMAAQVALAMPAGLASQHMAFLQYWLGPAGGESGVAGERRLTSSLAFWTWQRHTSLLYAKQSYTPVAKGLQLPAERAGGSIEPVPGLYRRLQELARAVEERTGSEKMGRFAELVGRCVTIAEAKGPLSAEDGRFLNDLDMDVRRLTGKADEPVVVDVHTEPNTRQVLEEGVGFPTVVEAKTAAGEKARGALFTHHEFKQPMSERLTDEAWAARLRKPAGVGPQAGPGGQP